MQVRELMSTPAVAVGPETRLRDVAEIMRSRQISSVPVVDADRRLLGLVSEADLLELEALPGPPQLPRPAIAAEAMTSEVVTVEADADARKVAGMMTALSLRHVPVLAEGRLAGVLSRRDLIGMLERPDGEVEAEVQGLLTEEVGRQAPPVHVAGGHVYVEMAADAPAYRLVEVLAASVPGVAGVSAGGVQEARTDRAARP